MKSKISIIITSDAVAADENSMRGVRARKRMITLSLCDVMILPTYFTGLAHSFVRCHNFKKICWSRFNHSHCLIELIFFSRRHIYDRSILSACFTYRTILDVILCVVGLVVSLSRGTASHKLLHIHFDFWRIMPLIHHTNVVCLQKMRERMRKKWC